MEHKSEQQSIAWFQTHYKEGRLVLRPPFQRKAVWTAKQRSFLVESILINVPIPEVYVQVTTAEDGSQEFGVVDGQQRIRTILQFIGIERESDQETEDINAFKLDKLPTTSTYRGKTFNDLTTAERKNFFSYEVCVRMLFTDNRPEVEDVFKRLNKYTLPLKAQELRNATYHGPFAKLSEELANNEYWASNQIVSPAAIRRMADIEMMSELIIGLLHGPQGGSAKIIDDYYEEYEEYEDEFPEQKRVERLFSSTLKSIKLLFPDIIEVPRWGNRADFYSLFVALGNLLKTHILPAKSRKTLAKKLISFAHSVDRQLASPSADGHGPAHEYARAIEKGVNDKARRSDRHAALVSAIRPFLKEAE